MDLDGIRENYYSPPEIDPTQANLLGPLPNEAAATNPPEINNLSAHHLAVMDAADKAKAEAAAAAAQGPPRFQSARDKEMTEEYNPRIAPDLPPRTEYNPVVSAEAELAAAKQLEAEKRARANPEPWRPKAHHTGQMTPEEIQEIRDEWEYYNTTPAQKYYDTGGQKQAATPNPTPQPMIPRAAASPHISPPGGPPGGPPPGPPTPPKTNSAYWHLPIPKLTLDNAGKLFKGGGPMLGGMGLAGATLVGGNALYKLLGTPPPERSLEEDIANDPRFNFDPKAPPRQR